jgi:hypothetical protein
MKPAAIGVRMHSGWGALVAVSHSASSTIEVVERWRVTVIPSGTAGAKQPYHFAKTLALADAEKFIGNCFAASKDLAQMAIREVVNELSGRQYRVVASAVLLASGRALPPLEKILASHAAIHTAEGEFFRDVFSKACHELSLPVTGFRERDLDQCLHAVFGKAATKLTQQVSTLGKSLGPPWTTDQKNAALAALLVLGNKKQ